MTKKLRLKPRPESTYPQFTEAEWLEYDYNQFQERLASVRRLAAPAPQRGRYTPKKPTVKATAEKSESELLNELGF